MSNSIIITVSLKKSNSKRPKIKLRDSTGNRRIDENLITRVDHSNVITWIADTISGISELTSIKIKEKENYGDKLFLLKDGVVKTEKGNFEGTIIDESDLDKDNTKMPYKIGFKIFGDYNEHWTDPVLQMKKV